MQCDEFYCSTCKQIYPAHLGIPRYGRIDCTWCHDCVKDNSACRICKSVPKWDKVSMPVKRVCKVKMDIIEAIVGEPLKYVDIEKLVDTTTKLLEPYKKKAISVWSKKSEDLSAILLHTDSLIDYYGISSDDIGTLTSSAIPPPLDMEAPELDCFSPGLNAPLASDSLWIKDAHVIADIPS